MVINGTGYENLPQGVTDLIPSNTVCVTTCAYRPQSIATKPDTEATNKAMGGFSNSTTAPQEHHIHETKQQIPHFMSRQQRRKNAVNFVTFSHLGNLLAEHALGSHEDGILLLVRLLVL